MRYQLTFMFVMTMSLVQVQLCAADKEVVTNADNERTKRNETSELCKNERCIRKCCPYGQGFTPQGCVNMSEPFNLTTWKGSKEFNVSDERVLADFVKCPNPRFSYPGFNEDDYHLTRDGNLHLHMLVSAPATLDTDHYCLDNFIEPKGNAIIIVVYCLPQKPDTHNYMLNAYCMIVSCFFILLTVGVYLSLPHMCNLPGKVLIAFLLSFFVTFLCLIIITFLKAPSRTTCTVFTFIIYYSIISAFSWINVMCYDTWCTFRRPVMSRLRVTRMRFLCYAAYAFSVPTALSAMLAIFEFTDIPVPIKPNLIAQKCFFDGPVKHYYLDLPILIQCIGNIIFFTVTAVKIYRSQREGDNNIYSRESNIHNKRGKQRFYLYVKLFTVMGISWILEVVGSFYPGAYALWQVIDVYNLLVGFVIFVMFVCKEKIRNDMVHKFKLMSGMTTVSTSQTTTTLSLQTQSSQSNDRREEDSTKIKEEAEVPILNGDRNMKCADYI